jgi:acetolactate synthase-1/2/3 large subunit
MNLSEKLFSRFTSLGLDYCACVSGGGIMYLLDAVGQNPKIKTKFFHHEQSAGIAAEVYAKAANIPSICLVTIGPGVANAVAAAFSCFLNSSPVIFISGAKRSNVLTDYKKQRFSFPQDGDTKSMVSGIVKEFYEITNPDDLHTTLTDAFNLAKSGRPGPVWISVPLDVQGIKIEDFSFSELKASEKANFDISAELQNFINQSKRTIIITGEGINSVINDPNYNSFVKNINLPFITSIGSNHTISSANLLNLGIYGPTGRRAANIALTNADSIIAIGTGLDIDLTGFDRVSFFENKKVMSINADAHFTISEIKEHIKITADLKDLNFFNLLKIQHHQLKWIDTCRDLNNLLSVEFETAYHKNDHCDNVDPYLFAKKLGEAAPNNTAFAVGISLDAVSISHSLELKETHRLYNSKHCGQLGWDIPACIGLSHTNIFDRVICVTGEGSVMFNLQDMTTLSKATKPVNVFIYDNDGYNSIRTSQSTHLKGRLFGSTLEDLTFPDWKKMAEAFGFDYFKIDCNDELDSKIDASLNVSKSITLVRIDPNRSRTPRLVSKIINGVFKSPKLSEQYPFLDESIQNKVNDLILRNVE